jgi:hypothetical protein
MILEIMFNIVTVRRMSYMMVKNTLSPVVNNKKIL